MHRLKTVAGALTLAMAVLGLSACVVSGASPADRLKKDMQDAAMSVPGVESAQVNVNINTSGNFINVKLVGTSNDEAALAEVLGEALPPMLEKTEDLESGSFAISIFSPDDAVSAGADALGYSGGKSLRNFREFFVN
ncbi:hypothetical protein NIBR502772_06665 [Pseudarthrobacter sp. NIBRBAC000502772]|uniref:hypothetical protein n=1 Tax=Pseudarthrobacter sp. NIBRBAC000502772 TaxID=2590775 RepID=UPI00113007D4|nr:hypothetical protein [Pseudarthrobacter sp. NIBRBAC000502772]QDG65936.1 hypothetical protein NIBR502772_06665 [Pseudarthrobacter sp. NIBRBAC000502772]